MEKNNFAGTPDARLADRKAERKRKVYMAITRVILYVLMTVIAACMILPFLWSLITSLRPEEEIMKLPMQWIPSRLTLEHYKYVFETIPFFNMFLNSVIVTVAGMCTKPVFRLSGGIRLFQDKIQRAQDRV